MKNILPRAACAAALLFASVSVAAISTPASAQSRFEIGFDSFHDRLANYGDWEYSDRWGEVWIPGAVPDDFRPYDTDGHWVYTQEYGWYWASDYEWGDLPFHYGRWVNDPDDGWMWIPGYVWSPAWVVWRGNGRYTGWMAMPPDDAFLGRGGSDFGISIGGISVNFNSTGSNYGYSRWYGRGYDANRFAMNWVFIPTGHMADRDYHRFAAPRGNTVTFINQTKNITNYKIVNNYVVNRSVDVRAVQRAGGQPVVAVHASVVIRNPQFVVRADQGRQVEMRVRAENPHGTGFANSAPAPSQQVVQSLSVNVHDHHHGNNSGGSSTNGGGQPPSHLFTRSTVQSAPLKPGANTNGGAPSNNGAGGTPTGATGGSNPMGPTGATGDNRHHDTRGATGPTGQTGTTPTTPPSNMPSPTGATGTGPTGATGEDRHHRGSTGVTGSTSPTVNPPNNASPNNNSGFGNSGATGDSRRHHEMPGATGGSGTPPPNTPATSSPTPLNNAAPNNTSGSGNNGATGEGRHHRETPGATGGNGAMNGGPPPAMPSQGNPSTGAGAGENGAMGDNRHHYESPGATGGASGPGGNPPAPGGPTGEHHQSSGNGAPDNTGAPPDDKKKKDKKDQNDQTPPPPP